ncbi:hypothetical protein TNCV_4386341 [Trichonephila clavipes]|nr:hypothetical protein TNCV_4386341 [Trichonephila clavipes]
MQWDATVRLPSNREPIYVSTSHRTHSNLKHELVDWKYTRIYNPQRRLRILVERCRTDSSQFVSFFSLIEDQPLP